MRVIKAASLGDAHEKAVRYVAINGELVTTEDGELTLQTPPLTVVIDKPDTAPHLSPLSAFKSAFAQEYAKSVLYGTKAEFEYDYHSRLCCYDGIDQIEYMIDKLTLHKTSRRAVAITWMPDTDEVRKDVPCLQLITCNVRNDRLDMQVVFRSNDVLSAMGVNMYGLFYVQKYIAQSLLIDVGTYTHVIMCPHIYHKRDENYLEAFK